MQIEGKYFWKGSYKKIQPLRWFLIYFLDILRRWKGRCLCEGRCHAFKNLQSTLQARESWQFSRILHASKASHIKNMIKLVIFESSNCQTI